MDQIQLGEQILLSIEFYLSGQENPWDASVLTGKNVEII